MSTINLGAGADLDTVTSPGTYTATNAAHAPAGTTPLIYVTVIGNGSTIISQAVIDEASTEHIRYFDPGVNGFSPWASVASGGNTGVTVTNFPATQAISAAALPLPTGAARAADIAAAAGTSGDAAPALPANASGIIGWLRKIVDTLTGGVTAEVSNFPASTAINNFPATQNVDGSVGVTNWPATQAITASALPLPAGAATAAKQANLDNDGGALSHVTNLPSVYPVSGAVTFEGTQPVSVTNLPATQAISAVALPLPTGAATSAKQPALDVDGGSLVHVTNLPATQTVDGVVAVSNMPAVQAISATVLPLPTGAASNATLSAIGGAAGDAAPALAANASGIIGWLRKIVDTLSGGLTTSVSNFPASTAVSNFPGTQNVSGTVSVQNLPATQAVSGTVSVANWPSDPATAANQASEIAALGTTADAEAAGNGSIIGILKKIRSLLGSPLAVTGTFYQATQPVSGNVGVSNFPATQAVSVAALPLPTGAATDANTNSLVGSAGAASPALATSASGILGWLRKIVDTLNGGVSISNFPTDTVVSNFPATQPVSAATLPLPTGAATSAKQPVLDGDGGALAHVTNFPTDTVVSNFPATQAISAAALPLPAGAATEATLIAVKNALLSSVEISGSVFTDKVTGAYYIRRESINESTGVVTVAFFNVDGTAASPTVANLIPADTSNVVNQNLNYIASAGGTGYSADDILIHTYGVDGRAGAVAYSFWLNATTGVVIAPPTSGTYAAGGQSLAVNFPATQAISAVALPLPTGASTAAKQDTGNAALGAPTDAASAGTADGSIVALLKTLRAFAITPTLPTGAATDDNLNTLVGSAGGLPPGLAPSASGIIGWLRKIVETLSGVILTQASSNTGEVTIASAGDTVFLNDIKNQSTLTFNLNPTGFSGSVAVIVSNDGVNYSTLPYVVSAETGQAIANNITDSQIGGPLGNAFIADIAGFTYVGLSCLTYTTGSVDVAYATDVADNNAVNLVRLNGAAFGATNAIPAQIATNGAFVAPGNPLPVSATDLPLPTGAATDANLTVVGGAAGNSAPALATNASGIIGWLRKIVDVLTGGVTTSPTFATASGSLTAPGTLIPLGPVHGMNTLVYAVTGTYVGSHAVVVSVDGVNYTPVNGATTAAGGAVNSSQQNNTPYMRADIAGWPYVGVYASTLVSGTMDVVMAAEQSNPESVNVTRVNGSAHSSNNPLFVSAVANGLAVSTAAPFPVNDATGNTTLGAPADVAATGDGSVVGVLKRIRDLLGNTSGYLATRTPDTTYNASLTALNAAGVTGPATANSALTITGLRGETSLMVQVTGTFVATAVVQGSVNGTNWVTIPTLTRLDTSASTGTMNSAGIVEVNLAGYTAVRVVTTAYTSGAMVIDARTSSAVSKNVHLVGLGTARLAATTLPISGTVAADVAIGSAIGSSARRMAARTMVAQPTLRADNIAGDLAISSNGMLLVKPYGPPELDIMRNVTATTSGATVIVAALGAAARMNITALQFQNTSATPVAFSIQDGSTVIWQGFAPANMVAPAAIVFPTPLRCSLNTAVNANLLGPSTVLFNLQGYQTA